MDDVEKFQKRLVKVTKQQNEDCKDLLRLMGVPVVEVGKVVFCGCFMFHVVL